MSAVVLTITHNSLKTSCLAISNIPLRISPLHEQKQRCKSTTECSQLAACTSNWSLLITSHVKAFPGRPTNIWFNPIQSCASERWHDWVSSVHHLTPRKRSGISRQATNHYWLCSACMPITTSIHAPTQQTIAMTNYTHAPTVINKSAFHSKLQRF